MASETKIVYLLNSLANPKIKIHWACISIPKLEAGGQWKPRRWNVLPEQMPASNRVTLSKYCRAFLYAIVAFVNIVPLVILQDKRSFVYTLQVLIVNVLLAAGNFCRSMALRSNASGEEPDTSPQPCSRCYGALR
ncbi:hypothetical protein Z517_09158 [Fonsecaea pedrosoi CBS 271.37]|uniref:Uncharacterized protein n=1 Tax=Fonsecaea pedrosoi CBS 271.37 TaxID=1442368 RepID=A0A0D2GWG4_9EURO|nr:uncharacterized protein Z517_09158 [Fonsecaea pedrosoi CBS 271.37]KIW76714.1 hypothetical protein Z517_09158 [Fonsecaea pedrosoi CBS 271.37]